MVSSISLVISSIGFGGGVVAIVHPIQAPINRTAMNAMKTGMATIQNLTSSTVVLNPTYSRTSTNIVGTNKVTMYPTATSKHTMNIAPPIA